MSVTATKVKAIIAQELDRPVSDIADAATWCDLEADALDMVNILVVIEETLHIEISDEDADAVTDVAGLVGLARRLVATR